VEFIVLYTQLAASMNMMSLIWKQKGKDDY